MLLDALCPISKEYMNAIGFVQKHYPMCNIYSCYWAHVALYAIAEQWEVRHYIYNIGIFDETDIISLNFFFPTQEELINFKYCRPPLKSLSLKELILKVEDL